MRSQRWVRPFRAGDAKQRELLGGKGANLCEMANLGLPVPPGFIVTTEACRTFLASGGETPTGLWDEIDQALAEVEAARGQRFGDPTAPLLVSVRSGAKFSMPGMMDTVLNLGLNERIVQGLAASAGERFALDAYRRLLQMFAHVVLGVDDALFEQVLLTIKRKAGAVDDRQLGPAQLRTVIEQFTAIIHERGLAVPDDPREQLRMAVLAVFNSWNAARARAYRRSNQIPDDLGTAVNIQSMVFGNISPDSASGVAFTRNPSTGERGLFGEYLTEAQGEDVVAGIRTPQPLATMGDNPRLRDAYRQLREIAERLEAHYRDMQDTEFTVERGRLWMLQTRTGKRTARAAVAIAVGMVEEGLIDEETAVRRVTPGQLEQLLHPRVDDDAPISIIATGLPASPGAAVGSVVFEPAEAKQRGEQGEAVILVRAETSADDFPGMERAAGILTARGGMTSHAAVVARGIGKPAVTGCSQLDIDPTAGVFRADGITIHAGDTLTLDGSTGRVILGRAPMVPPGVVGGLDTLLGWADRFRRLGVRANADTPADAARAREFGAEGIGLCRTEHMFFGAERLPLMQEMILADSDDARNAALAALEPLQAADFTAIFREMDGCPVKIRLLDPPLHEFLPHDPGEITLLAKRLGQTPDQIATAIEEHREANPMLGLRGCRLGLIYPEITRMQTRAILRAAVACAAEGILVKPEIMVPLVGEPEELRLQRQVIEESAEALFAALGDRVTYSIGTMIELPRAALLAGEIARYADFFSFGTNDLTQTTFGLSRDDAERFLPFYIEQQILPADPFQTLDQAGVGQLIAMATERGRTARPRLDIGICGEHGGDPASITFCHHAGLDYVSCSPFRLPIARLAAAHAALGATVGDV